MASWSGVHFLCVRLRPVLSFPRLHVRVNPVAKKKRWPGYRRKRSGMRKETEEMGVLSVWARGMWVDNIRPSPQQGPLIIHLFHGCCGIGIWYSCCRKNFYFNSEVKSGITIKEHTHTHTWKRGRVKSMKTMKWNSRMNSNPSQKMGKNKQWTRSTLTLNCMAPIGRSVSLL